MTITKILIAMGLISMFMGTIMRVHQARESSSALVFLHTLAPLAQQLGIQVVVVVVVVDDVVVDGDHDYEAVRTARVSMRGPYNPG